jgi:hypothetical protein
MGKHAKFPSQVHLVESFVLANTISNLIGASTFDNVLVTSKRGLVPLLDLKHQVVC